MRTLRGKKKSARSRIEEIGHAVAEHTPKRGKAAGRNRRPKGRIALLAGALGSVAAWIVWWRRSGTELDSRLMAAEADEPESKPEPKPESKPAPTAQADPKPAPTAQADPKPAPAAKPASAPTPTAAPTAAKPASQASPRPEAATESKPEPESSKVNDHAATSRAPRD